MRKELQDEARNQISFAIANLEGKAQEDYIMHTVKSAFYSGKMAAMNDIITLANKKQIEITELTGSDLASAIYDEYDEAKARETWEEDYKIEQGAREEIESGSYAAIE